MADSYQWYQFTGTDTIPIQNNEYYSNATTSNLTISNALLNMQSYDLRCAATNIGGTTFSSPAILGVDSLFLADAGNNTTICSTDFITSANMPSNSSGEWTCSNSSVQIINANSNIATISSLPVGSTVLTWIINQNNVCGQNTDDIVITTENPVSQGIQPSGETNCVNGTLTYSTTTLSNATSYIWSVSPVSAGVITGEETIGTMVWDDAFLGTASIKVAGLNSCPDTNWSPSLDITLNPAPNAPATPSGTTELCKGSPNTNYSIVDVQYANSYIWNISPTSAGTISGTGISAVVAWDANFDGTASIKVKAIGCGESDWSDGLSVNIHPGVPSQPVIASGETELCLNNANTSYYTQNVDDADSYNWDLASIAGIVNGNGINANVDWVDNYTGSANLRVQAVNVCGEGEFSEPLNIFINTVPESPDLPDGSLNLCTNSTTSYSISAKTNTESYLWDLSPVEAGTISGNGVNSILNLDDTYTGIAYIKVQGTNSCGSGLWSPILEISINQAPESPALPDGKTQLCKNPLNEDYTIPSVDNANTYSWNLSPATAGWIEGTDTISTVKWDDDFFGTASIKVYAVGCEAGEWSDELIVTIYEKAPGQLSIPSGATERCINSINKTDSVYTTFLNDNTYRYIWDISNNAGIAISDNNSVKIDWEDSFSGLAKLKVQGSNECGAGDWSDSLSIIVKNIPAKTNKPEGETILCTNSISSYIISEVDYANFYIWQLYPANAGSVNSSTYQISTAWNSGFSGTAYIKVKGANQCGEGEWSDSLQISINSPVVSNIYQKSEFMLFCLDSEFDYQWYYNGQPIASATKQFYYDENLQPGNYQVEITDKNGCSAISVIHTIGSRKKSLAETVKIFPNPATNVAYISIDNDYSGKINMAVSSNNGKILEKSLVHKNVKSIKIDKNTSKLTPGLYLIEFIFDGNQKVIKQLIIE